MALEIARARRPEAGVVRHDQLGPATGELRTNLDRVFVRPTLAPLKELKRRMLSPSLLSDKWRDCNSQCRPRDGSRMTVPIAKAALA